MNFPLQFLAVIMADITPSELMDFLLMELL